MEARAVSRYIRQSPRKLRQLVDLVKGMRVQEALNTLHFSKKRASKYIEKTIRSAVSNLINSESGHSITPEELYIKSIWVDPGPMWKRVRPASMGRASLIRRRTSHLNVIVAEIEKKNKK